MSYKIEYHNVGKNPLSVYMTQSFTVAERLFNYLVPFIMNKNIARLEVQSVKLAAEIGMTSDEFVSDYRYMKSLGKEQRIQLNLEERYCEMSIEVKKLNKAIQKGLSVLEHKLHVINRNTVPNINQRGSKRYISLNIKQVKMLIGEFNHNVREFVIDGKKVDFTTNRGLMIIIRKMIKNRMFSCVQAVKKKAKDYTLFIRKQMKISKINKVVSVKQLNPQVVDLIEEEIGKPTPKEIRIIHSWSYSYDEVKAAVLVVAQRATQLPGYKTVTNVDSELRRPKMNTTYFDQFLTDQH